MRAVACADAPLNVSFDQIDRRIDGASTPPPPSAFSEEVDAAKTAPIVVSTARTHGSAVNGVLMMIPIIGVIVATIQAASELHSAEKAMQTQQAMMQRLRGLSAPVLAHYSFYNGLARVDFGNLSMIARPDQNRTIVLNQTKKTYRVMNSVTPVYDMYSTMQPAMTSAADDTGTGIGQATIATLPSGATQIDDMPVNGFNTDATVTLTQSQGACHDGTFRVKQVAYYSSMPEPLHHVKDVPMETLGLPPGCNAYIQRQNSGSEPNGHMYVYKVVTVTRDPSGGAANYSTLSQRGNFRPLSGADSNLFQLPAGYQPE